MLLLDIYILIMWNSFSIKVEFNSIILLYWFLNIAFLIKAIYEDNIKVTNLIKEY